MARKFDEAGARQLIERWQTSDLSDSAFARRERVSIRLLRRWRDLFGEEPAEDLRLIPVVIRESDDVERRATDGQWESLGVFLADGRIAV